LVDLEAIGSDDFINRRPQAAYYAKANQYVVVFEYGQSVDKYDNTINPNIKASLVFAADLTVAATQKVNSNYQNNERHPFVGFNRQYKFVSGWIHGNDTIRPNNYTERSEPVQQEPIRMKEDRIVSSKTSRRAAPREIVATVRREMDGIALKFVEEDRTHSTTTTNKGESDVRSLRQEMQIRKQTTQQNPPAFLVANQMLINAPSSGDGTAVGEGVGITLGLLALIGFCVLCAVLAVFGYIKREAIIDRIAGHSLPSVGKKGFQEFTDDQ